MNRSGIYQILNVVTGKMYIGSALHIPKRFGDHKRNLRTSRHANTKLQHSWNKYGESAFTFSELEIVASRHDLIVREQHWIDTINAVADGYNILPIAGSSLGLKHSKQSCEKISKSKTGKIIGPMSVETKMKLSSGRIGNKWAVGATRSIETREKMAAPKIGNKNSAGYKNSLGYRHSAEDKARISEAALRMWSDRKAGKAPVGESFEK
jgi:group I intron endonuclease